MGAASACRSVLRGFLLVALLLPLGVSDFAGASPALVHEVTSVGAAGAASATGLGAAVEPGSIAARAGVPGDSRELTGARTQMSQTFANSDGTFTAVRSLRPLNYRDGSGEWQAIDTTLGRGSSGGFVNRANQFELRLPETLREPIRVSRGSSWVSFSLTGAAASVASVSGSSATYAEALPGATVRYASIPEGLKEDIVLAGPTSPRSFVFELETSPDLRVEPTPGGGLQFLTAEGQRSFAVVPPHMSDSSESFGGFSRAVSLSLERAVGKYLVTLTADAAWLADPARKWPVTVDPTLVVGGTDPGGDPIYLDCYLESGSFANTSGCNEDYIWVGHADGGEITKRRSLLAWDVSDIPANSVVQEARLRLGVASKLPYPPAPLDVTLHELIRSYDVNATWNTSNGTTAWTAAGGDFKSTPEWTTTLTSWDTDYDWFATSLVQGWVSGTIPNRGVLLKTATETFEEYAAICSADLREITCGPVMTVTYAQEEPPQSDSTEAPIFSTQDPVESPLPPASDCDNPDATNDGPPDPALCGGGSSPAAAMADAAAATSAPAVTWTVNADMFKFKNADGYWTIYKRCIDRTVGGLRFNVGPGYIGQFTRGATTYVNDYRGRSDTGTPGFLNAVNGGLGTFGWHHARGPAGNVPAGDDPTSPTVTEPVGGNNGRSPFAVIEGRMCAPSNGSYGVCARSWAGPTRQTSGRVDFTIDVWLREGTAPAGCPANAIARVRYRYSFYRSSVRAWMSVTTRAVASASSTPYVKEPKFTAITRGGSFKRMSILHENGSFLTGVMTGAPEGTEGLSTGHSDQDGRARVRWDFGTTTTGQQTDAQACSSAPCFNVVMRAYPVAANGNIASFGQPERWEANSRDLGLDRWAELSALRGKAYPRDTKGDNLVTSCGVTPVPDANGDGIINDFDKSKASEQASPSLAIRRRWEHGGWKSGATTDPYQAAFTFFTGWEDDRGPFDCEPVQRGFGPSGESFGTFASYSLGAGWTLR